MEHMPRCNHEYCGQRQVFFLNIWTLHYIGSSPISASTICPICNDLWYFVLKPSLDSCLQGHCGVPTRSACSLDLLCWSSSSVSPHPRPYLHSLWLTGVSSLAKKNSPSPSRVELDSGELDGFLNQKWPPSLAKDWLFALGDQYMCSPHYHIDQITVWKCKSS